MFARVAALEKLIKIALSLRVEQLALFVGAFAKGALRLVVGSKYKRRPVLCVFVVVAESSQQNSRAFYVQQPLPVRRICHYRSVRSRGFKVRNVRYKKFYFVGYARPTRVPLAKFYRFGVDVAAAKIYLSVGFLRVESALFRF